MATILDTVNGNLIRYLQGTTIAAAKEVIKNCPPAVFNDFAALCMFAAATNRRALEAELNTLMAANGALTGFMGTSCTVGGNLNLSLLILIGFLFLASNFCANSQFRLAFATKYGSANVHAATFRLEAAGDTRRAILTEFRNKYLPVDFNNAVTAINGLLDNANNNLVSATALNTARGNAAW